jgi:hypothetical protein
MQRYAYMLVLMQGQNDGPLILRQLWLQRSMPFFLAGNAILLNTTLGLRWLVQIMNAMKHAMVQLCQDIREDFGDPVSLRQLIANRPAIRVELEEPARTIAVSGVVRWDRLGVLSPLDSRRIPAGYLPGWKKSGGEYHGHLVQLDWLSKLVVCARSNCWACDIQQVDGFAASKAPLADFVDIDTMIEVRSPELINEISEDQLYKNLAHPEIRILHRSNGHDYFARYLWDGRTFLMNCGGSHHFAAARYIAARLGRQVPLRGELHTYSIDRPSVELLRCDFEMYVISDDPEIFIEFRDAMRALSASYLVCEMPEPYSATQAILLPRNELRSMRAAKVLQDAGVFDLGQYLIQLCERQERNLQA